MKGYLERPLLARQREAAGEVGERQAVAHQRRRTELAGTQQLPDGGLLGEAPGVGAHQALLVLEEIVEREARGLSGAAVSEQNCRPAGTQRRERGGGEGAAADAVEDSVGAASVRARLPRGLEELRAGGGRRVRSEVERQPAAVRPQIDGHDAHRGAQGAQHEEMEESHAAGAEDHSDRTLAPIDPIAPKNRALAQAAQNAGGGLEEEGIEIVEAVREAAGGGREGARPDQDPGREPARREQVLAKLGALGLGAAAAVEAGAAGRVVRHHDPVTRRERRDTRTGRDDLSHDLVSEDGAGGDRRGRQLEEVGTAESAPPHPQEELARTCDGIGLRPPLGLVPGVDRDDMHREVSSHQMERRIHRRFPRRIELRYWRPGETQGHTAYTTNISKSGLFVSSATALMPGERLRLEIVDRECGFFAEGRVARVHRVALALRQVDQPGVGVRFLLPEELVENLVPHARQSGPALQGGRAIEPEPSRPAATGLEAVPEAASDPAEEAEAAARAGRDAAMDIDRSKVVPIEFAEPGSFLSTYHRDISAGGLFVSTPTPMAVQETVWIEMQLPIPGERPRLFAARVIQRFEPQAAVGSGRNYLSGMAVQFLEPEKVLAELKPLLALLRR